MIAIATWFYIYARRPQRKLLDEQCPMAVFMAGKKSGIDQAELVGMMSLEKKPTGFNGSYFLKENYYLPALIRQGDTVTVR